MRQSLAQIEQAFTEQIEEQAVGAAQIQREAELRSRRRARQRTRRQAAWRFWALVMVLVATALIVTVVMFETLYIVMG